MCSERITGTAHSIQRVLIPLLLPKVRAVFTPLDVLDGGQKDEGQTTLRCHFSFRSQPLSLSRIAEICICRKVRHSSRKTERAGKRGREAGGGGRSWRWRGKARQLHPDPAIRPSVKRAETIEKDKRDI